MTVFIIILFGITMLYVATSSRIEAYVKALGIQGFLLFLLVLSNFDDENLLNCVFLMFETLAVKAILIPVMLIAVVRKNGIDRDIKANIPNFFSLMITSAIFGAGFFVTYWMSGSGDAVRPFYFGVSISTLVTGLFIIITRKKIITHVIGFMLFENGTFLLSLSLAREMPFIVTLGVLLDVFIAVYMFGLFVNKVHDRFEESHVGTIAKLKD